MAHKLGKDAKLYRGTAGSTAATLMTNVRDVTNPDERNEIDTSSRAYDHETVDVGQIKTSIEWSMSADEADADYAAILAAYLGRTAIALKCISGTSGKGIDGDFKITKLSRSEQLKDQVLVDVVAKPTHTTRFPQYV